jgi:large subunit ribosomal protein L21
MYAIVETGGKQYKVSENDVVKVELLDVKVGEVITLPALMVVDGEKVSTGNPTVATVEVKAEVVEHGKGKKLHIFKYKPKKRVRTKQGHRQPYTALKIVSIK